MKGWLRNIHTATQYDDAVERTDLARLCRCKGMQRAGVTNHLVVALDDVTKAQVEKFGSVAVQVNLSGDEEQKALQTGSSHAVSGTCLPGTPRTGSHELAAPSSHPEHRCEDDVRASSMLQARFPVAL